MGAAAASLKVNPISMDATNSKLRLLNGGGESNVPGRMQLIETIKNNVMAWTKWERVDGAHGRAKASRKSEF